MTDVPRIGASRIATKPDGTYTPDPAGEWAAVMSVMGFMLEPVGFGADGALVWDDIYETVDIVAWFTEAPDRWWLRRADATPIIGVRELRMAADLGNPITLFETPESWALADGHGVCVVIWGARLNELFDGVGRVECESPAHRDRFTKALRQWEPEVTGRRVRHAA